MNSRSEHRQPKVARVTLARSLTAAQAQQGGEAALAAAPPMGPQGTRQGTQTAHPLRAAGPTAPHGPRPTGHTANLGQPSQGPTVRTRR